MYSNTRETLVVCTDADSPSGTLLAIAHCVLEILRAHDGEHRPEDLLLGDAHVLRDVSEYRGLDEVALVVGAAGQAFAAARLARLFAADVDVLEVGVKLRLIDCGTDLDAGSMPLPTFSFCVRSTSASTNRS